MKESLVANEALPDDGEDTLFYRPGNTEKRVNRKKVLVTSALGLLVVLSCMLAVAGYNRNYWQNKHPNHPNHPQQTNYQVKDDCPVQPFDYLLLVFRWAPSVCLAGPCVANYPQQWVIHGLWPNFWDGSWPQFCCKPDKFDVKKVKAIEPQLLANWPNLLPKKSADSLWAHEWEKHGTCSTQSKKLVGEMNYFNSTLTLYNGYPVQKWLADAGINPNNGTVITESNFLSVIRKHIPNSIEIHCESVKGTSKMYIDSVSICLDKTSLTPIDCPSSKDTCKSGLIYPQS
jgi:ribonuclease T2